MSEFYDCSKLLSMMDITKKNKPELYIVMGNRSAGKSTSIAKRLMDDFMKNQKKFVLLYRYGYECTNVADKFFSIIQELYYPDYLMTQKTGEKDTYIELYIAEKSKPDDAILCGFCVCLNKADQLKKVSNRISSENICWMFFDEFQPENGEYCSREINKFMSIHTSLSRKPNQPVAYLPVILCSNYCSILSPYLTTIGASKRLQANTKFLRGDGWVLEQCFMENIASLQKQSAFNRAFTDTDYARYASEKIYLNDDLSLVSNMQGNNEYIMTFVYDKKEYAIRVFTDSCIVYVNKNIDQSYPLRFAVSSTDMRENTVLIKGNPLLMRLRDKFDSGAFRFADLDSKDALLNLLSY